MFGAESQIRITGPLFYRGESSRTPASTENLTGPARDDALTATRRSPWTVRLARSLRELGADDAIALILPRGNLISLALSMLQHRTWIAARAQRGLIAAWTAVVRLIFPR